MTNFRYMLPLIATIAVALTIPAWAQLDSNRVDKELAAANRSLVEGRVEEGAKSLANLLREIDPTKAKEDYWRTSSVLIDLLNQTENHALASQVINTLIATKIPESQSAYFQWTQFYLGKNLAYLGKADEGEKFLRALTAGDARLVHIPAQRAAALVLSRIELDRGNIGQSAIWMRRAVIGTLVDSGASSEEIVDALTTYANYLTETRRLPEADNLFRRLDPIYEKSFAHHGPKYLFFKSRFLNNLTALGNFPAAEIVQKTLKDNMAGVDVIANSVREQSFFQDLYQVARTSTATGNNPIIDRLKQIVSQNSDFLKLPRNRIVFSYFALLGGDIELADKFNSAVENSLTLDEEFSAYEIIIKSFIAARRGKFNESIASAGDALERIRLFHHRFENESSTRLPAITLEERLILSQILGFNAPNISTFDQANLLFQLEQYHNRDKGKLGLNTRVARQALKSDLQREDIRSRDRLQDLRDRLMDDAAEALLARALPVRNYSPGQTNNYAALIRLEEIEDKIVNADDQLQASVPEFSKGSADSSVDLATVQRMIKSNEALVLHNTNGSGVVTTCITSDSWTFDNRVFDPAELQQLVVDSKLVLAAVHSSNAPSAILDAEFPSESSYRLYQLFFGRIEKCLHNRTHILLATDPDFFSLPWNALITKPPAKDQKFSNRNAAWLPKSYSLSLLPSVRSLYQLRTNLPPSRAKENFFGIGAPELEGAPEPSKQIAVAPLFVARGLANRTAIAGLPALPETADELRIVAKSLGGTSKSHILLGQNATERELRKQPLNDYRVLSFATHAVVAGEVDGISEPALVLTPGPDEHNNKNDGLLTATEIANLTLDANMVILSACNTAASDGRTSGRGLSGLADAFFFAGARSVAVTQWTVDSYAAKQLGSGLISRSLDTRGGGVAEGLRQTMVEYIFTATEDYLANPRFWAAFIIAGDGAVRPLDHDTAPDESRSPIKLDWDYLSSNSADSEFLSLAKTTQSAFAIGIQDPLPGEQHAGSYLVRIQEDKNVSVIFRDREMAASDVIPFGNDLGLLGYYPAEGKSSAIFRLLEKGGQEKWRYVEDSRLWNFPVSIVETIEGYILISFETDFSPSAGPSTLILNKISKSGTGILQRRYPIPISASGVSHKNVIIDSKGNLFVAISGSMPTTQSTQTTMRVNPRTGSRTFCANPDATVLFSIGIKTLELQSQKILEDVQFRSIHLRDGRLYTAISFRPDCRLAKSVRLAELSPEFELKPIYQTNNVSGIDVNDFEVTASHFVLVGRINTFLPTALTRETMTLEQLKNYQSPDFFDDSFWEKSEDFGNAFILVIRKDGTLAADRVFPDLRHRSIANVTATTSNHFLAVGSAFGSRGWVIAFSFHEPGSHFRDRLENWIKWIWASFSQAR